MQKLISTALVIICFKAFSIDYIPFPANNALWSEYYHVGISSDQVFHEQFLINGEDTIINSKKYSKLYYYTTPEFNFDSAICIGGIREEDKKVYYQSISDIKSQKTPNINTSGEVLLYNFNLKLGDTVRVDNIITETPLILEQIDTITLANVQRKKYTFLPNHTIWIEGIGNTRGLLFTSGDTPSNGSNSVLKCFHLNNELVYMNNNFEECYPSTKLIKTKESTLNLYPNPVNIGENIILEANTHNRECKIQLYSSNGLQLKGKTHISEEKITIQTNELSSGIYFIKLINKSSHKTKKIIVK